MTLGNYTRQLLLNEIDETKGPRDGINMRRFPGGCDHYRENWTVESDDVLYEVHCLKGTPPLTSEEQELCMSSKRKCWRLQSRARASNTRSE